jgi:hypothetical protein
LAPSFKLVLRRILGCQYAIAVTLLIAIGGCNSSAPPASQPTTSAFDPMTDPAVDAAGLPVHSMRVAVTQPATTLATSAPVGADGFPADTDPRHTIPFLAGDELNGRLPGTPGLVRASEFLAEELNRIGLQPVPANGGYFQPFSMNESVDLDSSTRLELNEKPLQIKKDFDPARISTDGEFRGDVVFAGYGIARLAYDDYAGIDVRGKIVIAMLREPLGPGDKSRFAGPNDRWSTSSLPASKAHEAKAHGAAGLLLVSPPSSGGGDMIPLYVGPSEPPGDSVPTMQITRRVADLILTTAGKPDLKTLQDTINEQFKPASMALPDVAINGNVSVKRTNLNVRNVMGFVPGVGPHADEWVVVGAHYDHLGRGQKGYMTGGRAGSIWHGADDNASGTAAVLELADRVAHGPPPARSVLFVFFTAEEEGLIGSAWFVAHPPIPLDQVSSMLNLDMVGRLKGTDLQIGGAATTAAWDGIVADAVAGSGLTTSVALPDEKGRGGIGPSDHASFAMHKIPVLFLFTGLHADYHRPTDTADKINYAGIEQIEPVAQKIVAAMETMPRPIYDGRNDDAGMAMALGFQHRASLGVFPGQPTTQPAGVVLKEIAAGSPADKAGILAGDVLVSIAGKPVASLGDLSQAMTACRPGETVAVKVVRDGKEVSVSATLVERQ